jgi:hypothetical protein
MQTENFMSTFRFKNAKMKHIRECMEKLEERGITSVSGREIARASDYAYSPKFLDDLFEMVDSDLLRMNVLPYRDAGKCTVRYRFYLPSNYVEE